MYGRCKSFVDDHGTSDVDDGISDATFRTLQLVLAYNTSDWTYGWSYYMDGFSIFYSPKGEVVLDHMVSYFSLTLIFKLTRRVSRLTRESTQFCCLPNTVR